MPPVRLALANIPFPPPPERSVALAEEAIARAAAARADIGCFPQGYVPGYPRLRPKGPPPHAAFLERAGAAVAMAAAKGNVAVVLGTERVIDRATRLCVLVVDRDGTRLGFQDKVQLDPSEDATYSP